MWHWLSRTPISRIYEWNRERASWVLCEGVHANVRELEAQLASKGTRPQSAEHAQLVSNASLALDNACRVLDLDRHTRARTSSHLAAAQMHVNSARTMWLRTLPSEDLVPHLPDLFAIIKQHLPPDDTRRIAAEKAAWELQQACAASQNAHAAAGRHHWWTATRGADHSTPSIPQLSTVLDAVDAAREASLRERLRAVNFARIVWMTAFGLFCLACALAVAGAFWKSAVPLCFTPANKIACPSRTVDVPPASSPGSVASPGDYAIVEIAGLTAACIAAAAALRKVRGSSNAYGIPVALALLKLPTGALVAVLGIMLLRGEVVPGLSALDSSGQIIAWAVLLGYSQELFTNFVDKQGRQILEGVHGTADPKTPRETSVSEATATAAVPAPPPTSVPVPSRDGERRPANADK
ncbi:hypothetical protein GCM10010402_12490 [Actinomadura luteofluorescens]|uniref:hypothetical protein n=1 Tax=Actinomadura luteofluorescens TaxID=46163 RepID=UPI0021640E33|nr:hypothetical protein [Actinomadura glauciflava]MCR3741693.1 hypothetical protein [Actinomadura glauciflava]